MSACREPLRIGHGDWESQNNEAANRHAMANPGSLDFFADYAATQQDYPIG